MPESAGKSGFSRLVDGAKRIIGLTVNPSIHVTEAKMGRVVEAGKEKVVDLLEASKNVLNDYKDKAIDAFIDFPNKHEFATAIIFTLGTAQTALLGVAGYNAPAFEPSQRMMSAALSAALAILPATGSVIMFNDWINKSIPTKKEDVVNN